MQDTNNPMDLRKIAASISAKEEDLDVMAKHVPRALEISTLPTTFPFPDIAESPPKNFMDLLKSAWVEVASEGDKQRADGRVSKTPTEKELKNVARWMLGGPPGIACAPPGKQFFSKVMAVVILVVHKGELAVTFVDKVPDNRTKEEKQAAKAARDLNKEAKEAKAVDEADRMAEEFDIDRTNKQRHVAYDVCRAATVAYQRVLVDPKRAPGLEYYRDVESTELGRLEVGEGEYGPWKIIRN